ncbi:hypothetical protein ACI2K4_26820 [Micromonospora sp. NPDC050397]|uniref:hypothetical protein n=1 Tax=Micromonospora sp. NPDC050397 TaxID=3364279 RepID=UPI00384AA516
MTRAQRWGRRSPGAHGVVRDTTTNLPPPSDVPLSPDAPPAPNGSVGGASGGGDLADELAVVAGRRWWNRATVYLAALVLLVGGFVGGVQAQKSYGDPSGVGPGATGRGGERGAGGFAGYSGGRLANRPGDAGTADGAPTPGSATGEGAAGSGAAQTTTGTVKLVDGGTVYLETPDGTVVTVRTGADTAVTIARAGSLATLKAGDSVTATGPNTGGTVTASKVTAEPG